MLTRLLNGFSPFFRLEKFTQVIHPTTLIYQTRQTLEKGFGFVSIFKKASLLFENGEGVLMTWQSHTHSTSSHTYTHEERGEKERAHPIFRAHLLSDVAFAAGRESNRRRRLQSVGRTHTPYQYSNEAKLMPRFVRSKGKKKESRRKSFPPPSSSRLFFNPFTLRRREKTRKFCIRGNEAKPIDPNVRIYPLRYLGCLRAFPSSPFIISSSHVEKEESSSLARNSLSKCLSLSLQLDVRVRKGGNESGKRRR